jgi:hypothetical protein
VGVGLGERDGQHLDRPGAHTVAVPARLQPDWKAWFGQIDEVRDGGPDDPRFALILVDADTVIYMKREKSKPMVLFEVAKAMVKGSKPDVGETRKLQM